MSDAKKLIRKQIIKTRDELLPEEIKHQERQIFNQIKKLIEQHQPQSVHLYLAIHNEINTTSIIDFLFEKDIPVIIPKTYPKGKLEWLTLLPTDNLKKGMFGTAIPVKERINTTAPQMVLVPAVGFDRQGNRLGYGGGYYDRFLAHHPNVIKVGLAYPFQILDSLKTEPHDIPMDIILNGTEIFRRDH